MGPVGYRCLAWGEIKLLKSLVWGFLILHRPILQMIILGKRGCGEQSSPPKGGPGGEAPSLEDNSGMLG